MRRRSSASIAAPRSWGTPVRGIAIVATRPLSAAKDFLPGSTVAPLRQLPSGSPGASTNATRPSTFVSFRSFLRGPSSDVASNACRALETVPTTFSSLRDSFGRSGKGDIAPQRPERHTQSPISPIFVQHAHSETNVRSIFARQSSGEGFAPIGRRIGR